MVKVSIHGKMEDGMKANTSMIRSMAMESIYGQMEEDTKVNGEMVSNMDKVNIFYWINLLKLDYGKMERELNG